MTQDIKNKVVTPINVNSSDFKKELNTQFKAVGFPTTSHENWLYWSPDTLQETLLSPNNKTENIEITDNDITIINGKLVNVGKHLKNIEVTETPSYEVLNQLDINLDTSPISILNSIQAEQIILVKIKGNQNKLINISNFSSSKYEKISVVSKIVIEAEEGSHSEVFINHKSFLNETNTINTSFHLIAQKNSSISCKHMFSEIKATSFFHSMIYLYENAKCDHLTFVTNSQLIRHDTAAHFYEENINLKCSGVGILKNDEQYYNHLQINHYVKNCNCEQFFKNILDDQSIAEFSGLVFVKEGAHGVDSTQSNKTLLLSDKARVLSRPQLKIDADDVQCAHGSTIGQLNPEEVFYITSRGLSLKEAKALLVYGFAEEIIININDEELKTLFKKNIKETLKKINI